MADFADFAHFGLDARILGTITAMGYKKPTPIQCEAIPIVMAGGDVMGAAQTGTGKTASYGLPILQRLLPLANRSVSPARHPVRALVLAPTRELADQINENLEQYASGTGLRTAVVFGGVDIKPQTAALRGGVEILTATPGRLLDHLEQRNTNLSMVEIVVLDEADRMLDMGFLPDISRILNQLPAKRQSLMFSATFSEEVKKLAGNFLKDPVLVEVAQRNAAADTVEQRVLFVQEAEKVDELIELLRTMGPEGEPVSQALVFVNSKIGCRRLVRTLQNVGINADAIHGDKTQEERTATLSNFKGGSVSVLVATDVAARGLDIAELPIVINYDVPFNAEDYVHRIGRTGRAGSKGLAIMLMTPIDERNVKAVEYLTKQKFEREKVHPGKAARFGRGERGRRDGDRDRRDGGRDRPRRSRQEEERPVPVGSVAHIRCGQWDPIFDHPYETGKEGTAPAEAPLDAGRGAPAKKPKAQRAALLCGMRRR